MCLATEIDMKKNRWFIIFPNSSPIKNTWTIHNRSDAFDLEDDLELRIFEQFCFLKPKLPYGKLKLSQINLFFCARRFSDQWSSESLSKAKS